MWSCCRWRQSIPGFRRPALAYNDYMNRIPLLALSRQGPNNILTTTRLFLQSFTSSWVINRHQDRYDRVVGRVFWTSQHHAMLKSLFLISSTSWITGNSPWQSSLYFAVGTSESS